MKLFGFLIVPILVLLTSCVEEKSNFQINPDGTGKVEYQVNFSPMSMGDEDTKSDAYLHSSIKKILKDSEGVDAWKDVSFSRKDGGKIHFAGTAYFTDYNQLSISKGGMTDENTLLLEVLDGGKLKLGSVAKEEGDDNDLGGGPPVLDYELEDFENMSDEEIMAEFEEFSKEFKQVVPMLTGMFNGYYTSEAFQFSGALEEVSGFTKGAEPNSVSYVQSGEKMLATMNRLAEEPEFFLAAVKAGNGKPVDSFDSVFDGGALGVEPLAMVASGKPLFDYAAEVAAAKEGYVEMVTALGLPAPPKQVSGEIDFESIEVAGIRMIRDFDGPQDSRPFHQEPGVGLAIRGVLPGSVLDFNDGKVTAIVSDSGEDLMDRGSFGEDINFIRVSEDDGVTVTFELKGLIPVEEFGGFSKISGELEYVVGKETEEVDLGFSSLVAKEAGTEIGAKIKSLGKSDWGEDNQFEIEVALEINQSMVKELKILDASGKVIASEGAGSSYSGDTCTLTLRTENGKIPKDGKIIVERYTDLAEGTLEFVIEDVPLNLF